MESEPAKASGEMQICRPTAAERVFLKAARFHAAAAFFSRAGGQGRAAVVGHPPDDGALLFLFCRAPCFRNARLVSAFPERAASEKRRPNRNGISCRWRRLALKRSVISSRGVFSSPRTRLVTCARRTSEPFS